MDKEKRLSIDDNFETSPETEDMEVNAVPSDNENPVDESDVYYEDLFEDQWDEIEEETQNEKIKANKKKLAEKQRKARIDKERADYRRLQESQKKYYVPNEQNVSESYKTPDDIPADPLNKDSGISSDIPQVSEPYHTPENGSFDSERTSREESMRKSNQEQIPYVAPSHIPESVQKESYSEPVQRPYQAQEQNPYIEKTIGTSSYKEPSIGSQSVHKESSPDPVPTVYQSPEQKYSADSFEKTSTTLRNESYREDEIQYEKELQRQKAKDFVEGLKEETYRREEHSRNYTSFGASGVDFSGQDKHAAYTEKSPDPVPDRPSYTPSESKEPVKKDSFGSGSDNRRYVEHSGGSSQSISRGEDFKTSTEYRNATYRQAEIEKANESRQQKIRASVANIQSGGIIAGTVASGSKVGRVDKYENSGFSGRSSGITPASSQPKIHKAMQSKYYADRSMDHQNSSVNSDIANIPRSNSNTTNHRSPVTNSYSYTPNGVVKAKYMDGHELKGPQHIVSLDLRKSTDTSRKYTSVNSGSIPVGQAYYSREYTAQPLQGKSGISERKKAESSNQNTFAMKDVKSINEKKVTIVIAKKLGMATISAAGAFGYATLHTMRQDDAVNTMYNGYRYALGAIGGIQVLKSLPMQARRAFSATAHGVNYVGNVGRYVKGLNNKMIQGELKQLRSVYGPLTLQQQNRLDFLTKIEKKNTLKDYGVFTAKQYNAKMASYGSLASMKVRKLKKMRNNLRKLPSLTKAQELKLNSINEVLSLRKQGKRIKSASRGRARLKNLLLSLGYKLGENDDTLRMMMKGGSFVTNRYVMAVLKNIYKIAERATVFVAKKTVRTLQAVGKITGINKPINVMASSLKNSRPLTAIKKVHRGINGGAYNRVIGVKRKLGAKLNLKTSKNVKKTAKTTAKGFKKIGAVVKKAAMKVKNIFSGVTSIVKVFKAKYVAIGLLIILGILINVEIISLIAGTVSSVIMDDTENISSYVKVLNDKQEDFQDELDAKKEKRNSLGNKYDKVTFNYLNGSSTNNTKEILSMSAVRFQQDFSDKGKVKDYLKQLFDDSHVVTEQESAFYSCSGCKTRSYHCYDDLDEYASDQRIRYHNLYADKGGCQFDADRTGYYDYIPSDCKNYEAEQYTRVVRSFSGLSYDGSTSYLWWDSSYITSTGYTGAWKHTVGSSVKYIPGSVSFNPSTEGTTILTIKWYNGKYCILEEGTRYYCTYYKCPGHSETYCEGKHQDLTVNISVLHFDEIFWADSSVNGDLGGSAVAGEAIGEFKLTAYCTCHLCCHPYDPECTGKPSQTASGTTPTAGRTIAVDPTVIPMGSHVIIDGHEYIAEDTGGAIKGNRIDVFFDSHQDALNFGVKYMTVYWAEAGGSPTETPTEEGEWEGWTSDNIEWCKNIYNQDWADIYEGVEGLDFGTIGGTGSSLTDAELEAIIGNLPEDLSEERKEIIKVAAEAIGKIPYYWGGTASAPGWEGNDFGSPCTPDSSGRAQKGLDCSHFVDWVYWTAIGDNLGNGWTGTLWDVSKDVGSINNLQPGDIGFMNVGHDSNNHVGIYVGNGMWIHCTGSPTNMVVMNNTSCFRYYRTLNVMNGK